MGSVSAKEVIYSVGFYSEAEERIGTKKGPFSLGASHQPGLNL